MADKNYLLIKRGLYYRPDNMGYTGFKDQAGRYSCDEAVDGVTAMHEDEAPDYAPACFTDLALNHLAARVEKLEAVLKENNQ